MGQPRSAAALGCQDARPASGPALKKMFEAREQHPFAAMSPYDWLGAACGGAGRRHASQVGRSIKPWPSRWMPAAAAAWTLGAAAWFAGWSFCSQRWAALGLRFCNTGSESAHAAQHAAGDRRSACIRPRPPREAGRKAMSRLALRLFVVPCAAPEHVLKCLPHLVVVRARILRNGCRRHSSKEVLRPWGGHTACLVGAGAGPTTGALLPGGLWRTAGRVPRGPLTRQSEESALRRWLVATPDVRTELAFARMRGAALGIVDTCFA